MRVAILLLALAWIPFGAVAQQTFSCPWGDRASCLGFGETVCSSAGRCVGQDAVCFDNFQCNYEGFTCRSNVTECVDDYDDLQRWFNTLVGDYNQLLDDNREVRAAFEITLGDLEETRHDLEDARSELRRSERALDAIRYCVEGLSDLDDPGICLP